MKQFVSLVLIAVLTVSFTGCIDPQVVLDAADAGLKAYEGSVPAGSDQYTLADKIDDEIHGLAVLYADAKAASKTAQPGIASQIADVAAALTKDSRTLLDLAAVKNPNKRLVLAGVIASVDAFITIVQDAYPNPSGNSVQLNSTAAQLKAAVK